MNVQDMTETRFISTDIRWSGVAVFLRYLCLSRLCSQLNMHEAGSGGRRGASDCQFKEECLGNGKRNAVEIGSVRIPNELCRCAV